MAYLIDELLGECGMVEVYRTPSTVQLEKTKLKDAIAETRVWSDRSRKHLHVLADAIAFCKAGQRQVIVGLQIHPILRRSAEKQGQPDSRIRRDRPLSIDNGADPVHRHADVPREPVEADTGLPQILVKDEAGMNWSKFFCHSSL